VRSYIKDGTKKKKITFGCHRKRLYTVQHAMTMKNKKEAGSKSLVLYSQNVKKTLLRVPKDGGTHSGSRRLVHATQVHDQAGKGNE
jgi:hypothetical protein